MTIDWNGSGRHTTFRYVRVRWPSFAESGEIGGVAGCRIEESMFTALKASGELDSVNMPDLGDDMVRVYSDSVLGGRSETVCHGTFFASRSSDDVTGPLREGPVQLYSTLLAMRQARCEQTHTALQGANAVDEVSAIVRRCGLRPVATPSAAVLNTSHSWDPGTEYLEIANDLLEMIGYGSLTPDAYGNAVVAPYVDPASKAPAARMSDTADSTGAPTVAYELDDYDTPNVVVVVYSNADDPPMVAVAENSDPVNAYSTVSRGKRIVRAEEVSEIASAEALRRKAEELLREGMTAVESVEIPHSWSPFGLGDAVDVDYRRSGLTAKMTAATRTVEMTPDIACETRFRRSVPLA